MDEIVTVTAQEPEVGKGIKAAKFMGHAMMNDKSARDGKTTDPTAILIAARDLFAKPRIKELHYRVSIGV